MKFLIYANAPTVPTGYGVQCALLATRLKRDGHDVAVACNFGHHAGVVDWPTPYGPVRLYWQGMLENSIDIVTAHADHFFEGDKQAGWIIPLNDVWALDSRMPMWNDYKVLAWTPVDHWPCPDAVLKFFHNSGARPIAMSRFGEQMLIEGGLSPLYAPLAIDTEVYRPTWKVTVGGELRDARTVFQVPAEAFVVGMVAMNKDPKDRKNFAGAFRAFGRFWKEHKNAVLLVHTDPTGMYGSGIDLHELSRHAAIPPHALKFTDAYAQRAGFPAEMMAGFYTACDVLLAPSRGEGFCVPMIEAQACGTPVICSDFTAQSELCGAGWKVDGQLDWDAPMRSSYIDPFHNSIFEKLMEAYEADFGALAVKAREFAVIYDADRVYENYWQPLIESLEPAERPLQPKMERVDVIVPLVREANEGRLRSSIAATTPSGNNLLCGSDAGATYAENVNALYKGSTADWILVVGDDVEFKPGWFEAAQALSDRYDVIGTNDSEPGRIRNPLVANGSHADHFFIRRKYIEEQGACLDGPGRLMPEVYQHWWVDKEVIELAKARGVFTPCLDSIIVHHHPGYDGDEAAREADPVYMKAAESAEDDRRTFMARLPLIQAIR